MLRLIVHLMPRPASSCNSELNELKVLNCTVILLTLIFKISSVKFNPRDCSDCMKTVTAKSLYEFLNISCVIEFDIILIAAPKYSEQKIL